MSLEYSATQDSLVGFQSPPQKIRNQKTDNSQISSEKNASRHFLSVLSPGRKFNEGHSHLNASLLSALFPNSPGIQPSSDAGDQRSPYRQRSNSNQRNEQEYKENLQQTLKDQGYEDQDIQKIQSNMILYKSIASISSYRDYMKERMRKARDSSLVKARVSTVNTKYTYKKDHRQSSISSAKRGGQDHSHSAERQRLVFNASKSSAGLSNVKSQKIIEIEQIMNDKKKVSKPSSNVAIDTNTVSPDQLMQELNKRQIDRNSIFNSIEELKKKEQNFQDLGAKEEFSLNDLSRDLQESQLQMNSPPPKPIDKPMKIDEIIQNRKKTSKTQSDKKSSVSANKSSSKHKFLATKTTDTQQSKQPQKSYQLAPEQPLEAQAAAPQITPMRRKANAQQKVGAGYGGSAQHSVKHEKIQENKFLVTHSDLTTEFQSPQVNSQKISSVTQNSIFKSPSVLSPSNNTSKLQYKQECSNDEEYKVEMTQLSQAKSQDNLLISGVYQRKKDETVQQLLEEFRKLKEEKRDDNSKFYQRGESPTKRLIELKRASHIHQPSVKDVKKSQHIEYSIRYVASPERSYLVNPTEGEINYDLAYKNFDKFYDKMANQPIVKYKIQENQERKNENKGDKWFKTPNKVVAKETTRTQMRGGSSYIALAQQRKQQ